MIDFSKLNYLAILVAALSRFAVGALWYGPLFGKAWLKENNLTEEGAKGNPLVQFGGTFVLSLLASFALAMFLGPAADVIFGLFASAMTGVFFVSTAIGVIYLFERKSFKLFLINAGYQTVTFIGMGAILGAWK